jgi:hypothetical protein
MPAHYVEDYEEVTGKKLPKSAVTAKVISTPAEADAVDSTEAETKGK